MNFYTGKTYKPAYLTVFGCTQFCALKSGRGVVVCEGYANVSDDCNTIVINALDS